MSDAHWAATIKAMTRFGEGDIKTIAKGNINISKDLQDIFAGKANLENGQMTIIRLVCCSLGGSMRKVC